MLTTKLAASLVIPAAAVALATPAHADSSTTPSAVVFVHAPNGGYYAWYKDGSHLALGPKATAVADCGHRRPACVHDVGTLYSGIRQAWLTYSAGIWKEAAAEGATGTEVGGLTMFKFDDGATYWVQTFTQPGA